MLSKPSIFICLLILSSSAAFSQFALKGKVLNAETGQPLPSISVYLNNTSIGTTTNGKGEFVIGSISPGKYKLVVSSAGFKTFSKLINTREPAEDLLISLRPAAEQLKSIEVTPPDPNGWTKWGKLFTQIFIGTTPVSFGCHILNPDVIKFRMIDKNTLDVYANEPIQLENIALGYDITFKMEEFDYNFSNKVVVYNGYAFFKDLATGNSTRSRKRRQRRLEIYNGSLLHFMRTFFVNKLDSTGFEMRNLGKIANAEKQRAKDLFAKNKRIVVTTRISVTQPIPPQPGQPTPPDFNKEVNQLDSTDYFKKALLQPDSIISHQPVPADSVGFAVDSFTAGLYFPDSLEVSYKLKEIPAAYKYLSRNHKHETFPISQFVFINKKPIYILSNGFYYGPHDLKITGYWAWSETMATLLPYDYVP